MLLFLLLSLVKLLLFVPHATADGCKISLSAMPDAEPVLLTAPDGSTSFELFKPTGETTTLSVGTKLQLHCSGSRNAIQFLEEESLELICSTGNILEAATGEQYELHELGCKSIPTADLKLTSVRCTHDRGYLYEAGFATDENHFASVFTICYDNVTENTLYTHNIINGAAINNSISESTRRAFRAEGMKLSTTDTNNYYTINNQISRFEAYFGELQTYVNNSMYLARGHLTPDADFIMRYEQLATYFYTNVAPEFQVVNAGNWLRVENLARSMAATLRDDLAIYNGYMGQLKLLDAATGNLVSIYLEDTQQIEVPKYYFKVIRHEASDAAIVFITLNNPFAQVADEVEFCSNVCAAAGVSDESFKDTRRGYTFCCELDNFKQHYPDLPDDVTALNLLTLSEDVEITDPVEIPTSGCLITMPTDIPNPEPVYVVTTLAHPMPRLLKPHGQYTALPVGSNLTLFCAGSGNTLSDLGQATLVLTCQEDNSFYSFEKLKTFTLPQLNCSRIPTPDILLTSTSCSNGNGYIFKPGFDLQNNFVDAFVICYNNVTETTLYSRNVINGVTQTFKIEESARRSFRANGLKLTTSEANTYYTINNQISRFDSYFGTGQTYVNRSMFMSRGHLAPDADFIFGYEQVSTYYYANVVPEFQSINAANWIRVENIARGLAAEFESDLLVYTSSMGVLQLPTNTTKLESIYLDDGHLIEVPKWIYKIMIHPELESDLVMITLNNPFANPSDIEEFCPNVCDRYGVNSPHFVEISSGYTFCCTLEDFRKATNDLPSFDLPEDWKF